MLLRLDAELRAALAADVAAAVPPEVAVVLALVLVAFVFDPIEPVTPIELVMVENSDSRSAKSLDAALFPLSLTGAEPGAGAPPDWAAAGPLPGGPKPVPLCPSPPPPPPPCLWPPLIIISSNDMLSVSVVVELPATGASPVAPEAVAVLAEVVEPDLLPVWLDDSTDEARFAPLCVHQSF